MDKKSAENLKKIQMLVLDVDGVLTDGTLIINGDGSESKAFNTLDGHGIRMWRRAGLKTAFLSGRKSEPTQIRAQGLEVDYVYENSLDKLKDFEQLLKESGLSAAQIAYIGDDLPDMPVMKRAGFAAAVANAVDEVKQCADYITAGKGGSGAVREVIEYILKGAGKWQRLIERYLA